MSAQSKSYDERQTELCDKLYALLQGIAVCAVEAQSHVGADRCADLLDAILTDAAAALELNDKLTSNDF